MMYCSEIPITNHAFWVATFKTDTQVLSK
jgi:hypothetical protein